jgi:hypothetical protein
MSNYDSRMGIKILLLNQRNDTMRKKLTVFDVKKRLFETYGSMYTFPYIDIEFNGPSSCITILCPVHGEVKKTLKRLLYNQTVCPNCGPILSSISRKASDKSMNIRTLHKHYECSSQLGDR